MFKDENALPSTKGETALDYGDHFARSSQDHAKVRRGVVASFGRVHIVVFVLGHDPLEKFVQIRSGGRIRIFINHQAGTGVLEKDGGRASFNPAFTNDAGYLFRDLVGAFAPCPNAKCRRMRVHARRCCELGGRAATV